MNERTAELWADFKRYLAEAGSEWMGSVDDSPPSHVYTAIFAITGYIVLRWIL